MKTEIMTTKRSHQSESEPTPDDVGSPTSAKVPKISPVWAEENADEDLPNLPFGAAHNLRVSVRNLRKKEERKESESCVEDFQGGEEIHPNAELSDDKAQKKKRSWDLWSAEDQKIFFEALNDCGKNFDAIEVFFQNKSKKGKNVSGATTNFKHKEQIRTFYYRTWHKISKYIEFPETLKKSSRELYALINFGELRKKVGNNLDCKKGSKLQELVFNGHTTVRCKGKTVRLRTPTCQALKRLNLNGDSAVVNQFSNAGPKDIALPNRVTLELSPLLVSDFNRVNRTSLSNPRISFHLSLDRRLSRVIQRLEEKFTPHSMKTWLSCVAVLPQSSELKISGPLKGDSELWLVPRPGTTLSQPSYSTQEPATSSTLSLNHLQSKLEPSESGQPHTEGSKESQNSESTVLPEEHMREVSTEEESKEEAKAEVKDEGGEQAEFPIHNGVDGEDKPAGGEHNKSVDLEEGWNLERGSKISLGELYCMMGGSKSSSKPVMQLCYTWKKKGVQLEAKHRVDTNSSALSALIKLANAELVRRQSAKGSTVNVGSPLQMKRIQKQGSVQAQESSGANIVQQNPAVVVVETDRQSQGDSGSPAEFRRPAAPAARSQHQAFRQQIDLLLPKYNQRKGRPMSRPKSFLARQLQAAANRPLQPKISSQDGVQKKPISPLRKSQIAFTTTTTVLPNQITMTVGQQFLGLSKPTTAIIIPSSIPQISIPSPAHSFVEDSEPLVTPEEDSNNHDTSFSLSLFDENSRTELESGLSRNATSTPSHLQVDHFLDSVLENSNNSLLQTPRRSSPPPSPPGGMSEHSWLPDISLSSILGNLPTSESPSKLLLPHQEDSMQSTGSEVDRQLSMMLNENSLDFTNKFAHLASALNSND